MRACVQRVSEAQVTVEGAETGRIGRGLVVLLGVGHNDGEAEVRWLAEKIVGLRVFEDDAGKMNLSLADVGGGMLVVSQFTLYADLSRGRRPGFTNAAQPDMATRLVDHFVQRVKALGFTRVETGSFGAHMHVALVNDGPFTIWLNSD
jgi:D-tyrosyl-tRNA(Tyr) deacylase